MTRSKLPGQMGSLGLDASDDSHHGDFESSFIDEFHGLAKLKMWKVGSKAWKRNWEVYTQAENERLSRNRAARLESWQQLCEKLGLEPPASIRQCKKVLNGVYVNMVDLFECWATGERPKKFKNAKQLAAYTKSEGKFFNRNLAKENKVLCILLKHLA